MGRRELAVRLPSKAGAQKAASPGETGQGNTPHWSAESTRARSLPRMGQAAGAGAGPHDESKLSRCRACAWVRNPDIWGQGSQMEK